MDLKTEEDETGENCTRASKLADVLFTKYQDDLIKEDEMDMLWDISQKDTKNACQILV